MNELSCSRLRDLGEEWQSAKCTPIHGDFNYSQILFDSEKPIFIDFDSASSGDPLYDVTHFVVGLHWLAAQKHVSSTEVKRVAEGFCNTYANLVPWNVSESGLRGHIAMALICRRAYKVLRTLERDTLQKIKYYIDLAQEYLT